MDGYHCAEFPLDREIGKKKIPRANLRICQNSGKEQGKYLFGDILRYS
jgi:hypothetical protein